MKKIIIAMLLFSGLSGKAQTIDSISIYKKQVDSLKRVLVKQSSQIALLKKQLSKPKPTYVSVDETLSRVRQMGYKVQAVPHPSSDGWPPISFNGGWPPSSSSFQ